MSQNKVHVMVTCYATSRSPSTPHHATRISRRPWPVGAPTLAENQRRLSVDNYTLVEQPWACN